jgi:hypothetical protein
MHRNRRFAVIILAGPDFTHPAAPNHDPIAVVFNICPL